LAAAFGMGLSLACEKSSPWTPIRSNEESAYSCGEFREHRISDEHGYDPQLE
jgi:hypothetical protein